MAVGFWLLASRALALTRAEPVKNTNIRAKANSPKPTASLTLYSFCHVADTPLVVERDSRSPACALAESLSALAY